jgi:integrase
VRFPFPVTHRDAKAKIYGRRESYPYYRLAYSANGKRIIRNFKTFAEAKEAGERAVRAISAGNGAVAALGARDAAALRYAHEALADLSLALNLAQTDSETRAVALRLDDVISEFTEAKRALGGSVRLIEAVRCYQQTLGTVRRIAVADAVAEFLKERETKSVSKNGDRAQLSAKYVAQDRNRLDKFKAAFVMDVCDLSREQLDLFFAEHLKKLAPRSRNHYRSTLQVWIKWCVRREYLARNHQLDRSEGLCPGGRTKEVLAESEIEIYTAEEFASLLSHCQGSLVPVVALAGLAGLRIAEILRLSWADVWRRPGYIEVTGSKAKTRQRRLVPICDSMAAWLELFRGRSTGFVWDESEGERGGEWLFLKRRREACVRAKVPMRDNALRHSFASYRLALIHNEHQVATEMGSSAQMLHQHYRQLATEQEAKEWFNVQPAGAAGNVVPLRSSA